MRSSALQRPTPLPDMDAVVSVRGLGKTYGNLMVDLRAWNDKLIDRSRRILMETTGLDRHAADDVITRADGQIKRAIVMARRGVSREEADRLLEVHQGRLRSIVGDPPPVSGA